MVKIIIILLSVGFIFSITAAENMNLPQKNTKVPESLKVVWGLDGDSNYYKRYFAVHKLAKNLQPGEIKSLFDLLHSRLEEEPSMSCLEFNSLKNEIVILLMNQNVAIYPEISRELIGMYQDKTFDEVWRNYCVQFMGQIYIHLPDDERKFVKDALTEAVSESKNSIGGTALIALKTLSDNNGFDRTELAKAAYSYVTASETVSINKVTALQICAQLDYAPALEIARKIAEANNNDISLKMSAIAAVGLLGDSSDIPRLESFGVSSDMRVRTAAVAAIKNIRKKNS